MVTDIQDIDRARAEPFRLGKSEDFDLFHAALVRAFAEHREEAETRIAEAYSEDRRYE